MWQILPKNLVNSSNVLDKEFFDKALSNGQHVILYNHGNSGHRVAPHRVELYAVLRQYFHVIAFDYRSKYCICCLKAFKFNMKYLLYCCLI